MMQFEPDKLSQHYHIAAVKQHHRYTKHLTPATVTANGFGAGENKSLSDDNNNESGTERSYVSGVGEEIDRESLCGGSGSGGGGSSRRPVIVYVGDGRNRVRRVVSTKARHITVVSYSTRHKETRSHTSYNATTVSVPQRLIDHRSSPAYSTSGASSIVSGSGGCGGYVYLQTAHHPEERFSVHNGAAGTHHHHYYVQPQQQVVGPASMASSTHRRSSRSSQETFVGSRIQNGYELSQDLLDKQVELLERKYGGLKARRAAIIIQRAYRRYKMARRFDTITAKAKMEPKSRRRPPLYQIQQQQIRKGHVCGTSPVRERQRVCGTSPVRERQRVCGKSPVRERQRVCATILPNPHPNKRRHDSSPSARSQSSSPAPSSRWSQSPTISQRPHPYVNLLHQQHYFNQRENSVQYSSQEFDQSHSSMADSSLNSSSMNSSWTSQDVPYTPYYSASQIYLKPRQQVRERSPGVDQLPPEIPTRTSSLKKKHPARKSSSSSRSASLDRSNSPLWKKQQEDSAAAAAKEQLITETLRKRQYRIGLNLFNKKPEKGINFLIRSGFVEDSPAGVAKFLLTRKGLSRQMIGEFLGDLQSPFAMEVLNAFAKELDFAGLQVDEALRKFQSNFRLPGEAQKIERLMEIFSQRYGECNPEILASFKSSDTIFVLAFAIIMLNTDLHTPSLKADRRMRCEDFIKNLRGVDDCHDISPELLTGIYDRVKTKEFRPDSDHVSQVNKVAATLVGKKPNLALPHRRLVCYCRLYEVADINKRERNGSHQREIFLFNDLLVVTKLFSKKKAPTYTFRQSVPLAGLVVSMPETPNYPFLIRISQKGDNKSILTFNARNEHDRTKFAEDLIESVSEIDEMEALRIEGELERQKSARDSGVGDVEVPSVQDPKSSLRNSLLDMHEQCENETPRRRGSVGSLDSGMSVSFQSTSASIGSRNQLQRQSSSTRPASVSNSPRSRSRIQYQDDRTTNRASFRLTTEV